MKGWKTVTVNILAAVLPVLETMDMTNVLDEKGFAIYGGVLAIINLGLRMVTTTPVGKRT